MTSELRIEAPDRRRHHDQLIDLVSKVFSTNHGYYLFRDECCRGYIDHCHYDWLTSRVGLIGDRLVSHWGVYGYRMRIGSAAVRVSGIGAVATDPDFRGRGLMTQTAVASIEATRQAGYDMSLLFGIDNFYHRFNYVRSWGETSYIVDVAALPSDLATPALRALRPVHSDDLADMYNRSAAGLTGTAIRPTFLHRNLMGVRFKGLPACRWFDGRGKLAGYVIAGIDKTNAARLNIQDFAGPAEQVLAAVAALARKNNRTELHFAAVHHDSEVAQILRRGTLKIESAYRRNGGPMISVLNLNSTLAKMQDELSRRLAGSHLASWSGSLLLDTGRDKACLAIGRGKVRVADAAKTPDAIHGGDAVVQLLIGTTDPAEIVQAQGMKLTGRARQLLPVLFPDCHPTLNSWDKF